MPNTATMCGRTYHKSEHAADVQKKAVSIILSPESKSEGKEPSQLNIMPAGESIIRPTKLGQE